MLFGLCCLLCVDRVSVFVVCVVVRLMLFVVFGLSFGGWCLLIVLNVLFVCCCCCVVLIC